jgi:hypothetical protein
MESTQHSGTSGRTQPASPVGSDGGRRRTEYSVQSIDQKDASPLRNGSTHNESAGNATITTPDAKPGDRPDSVEQREPDLRDTLAQKGAGDAAGPPKLDADEQLDHKFSKGEAEFVVPGNEPDPQLDYEKPAYSLAAPVPQPQGSDQTHSEFRSLRNFSTAVEPETEQVQAVDPYENPDTWGELGELEDWPEELTEELMGLVAAYDGVLFLGEQTLESINRVAHLIPYQLSGLAEFVPLPPGSPLRNFIISRQRPRPGSREEDGQQDDQDQEDQEERDSGQAR